MILAPEPPRNIVPVREPTCQSPAPSARYHEHPESVKANLGVRPVDIAKAMLVDEVPEDVRYLVELIRDLCEP